MTMLPAARQNVFLSTLSLRRATRIPQDQLSDDGYFYPRSPCGERLSTVSDAIQRASISIHALLAESDEDSTRSTVR